MKKLSTMLIAIIFLSISVYADDLKVGRVHVESENDIQFIKSSGATIFHSEQPGVIDIVCDDTVLSVLRSEGWFIDNIQPFESTGLLDIDSEFHTYEELTDELQQFAVEYPDICKLDSIGRAEQFDRTIWCMKISDNAAIEEDELSLLYIGVHHACEVMGGETLLYMINQFLENYGTDPQITQWVDDYEIFIVPMMNPDGHHAVTSGITEYWRKNARDTNNNGIYYEVWGGTWFRDNTDGVNLNGNYDWSWNISGNTDPLTYDYPGESPFSEHETQAIRDLGLSQNFVCGISFHSFGEKLYIPWQWDAGIYAPDQGVINDIGGDLAGSFLKDNGTQFSWIIFSAFYGECRNWFYGALGSLFFCVEVNPSPMMVPPGYQLQERAERYYNGAIFLLERLSGPGITGHVTDAVTGEPIYAEVEIASPLLYQVDPRYNDPETGRYTRLLESGESYELIITADNYQIVNTTFEVTDDTLMVMDFALEPLSVGPFSNMQPSEYKINLSCYPNPFNDETVISYSIPKDDNISITVYDISGRQVASLIDGYQTAGTYSITFNAKDLVSGVYFVRLEVDGGQSMVQKLVLMK